MDLRLTGLSRCMQLTSLSLYFQIYYIRLRVPTLLRIHDIMYIKGVASA